MRVLKFLKIDCLKMKSLWIALFFPLLSIFILITSDVPNLLFAAGYCLFAGIIYATFPFTGENPQENGFLMMLPSKPGEDILGHFLFGFLAVTAALFLGLFSIFVSGLINSNVRNTPLPTGFILVLYGAAVIFVGLEELLLTVFRYESIRAVQLIRIVPAFVYFFAANAVMDRLQAQQTPSFAGAGTLPVSVGAGFFAAALVVYIILTMIAVRIVLKRDF